MHRGVKVRAGGDLDNGRLVSRQFGRDPGPDGPESLAGHHVTALGDPGGVRISGGYRGLRLVNGNAVKKITVGDGCLRPGMADRDQILGQKLRSDRQCAE